MENNPKYINSTMKILYKNKVLTHAHSISENQKNWLKFTTDQPLKYIKKAKIDLSLRNASLIQPCTLRAVTCIS